MATNDLLAGPGGADGVEPIDGDGDRVAVQEYPDGGGNHEPPAVRTRGDSDDDHSTASTTCEPAPAAEVPTPTVLTGGGSGPGRDPVICDQQGKPAEGYYTTPTKKRPLREEDTQASTLLDSMPTRPPTLRPPLPFVCRSRQAHTSALALIRPPTAQQPRTDDAPVVAATAVFPVEPLKRFWRACARYQRPCELTTFSYDASRAATVGDSEMKYLLLPDLQREVCDLSVGYDTYVTRADVDEHIDALLDALTELEGRKGFGEATADFVCYRGIMTKILTAPYAREPWELRATRFRGTIFLEEHETEEAISKKHGRNEMHRLMSYWGYKFESYCTSPKPADETTPQDLEETRAAAVNTNIQHCVVVKSKLGGNSIIMGAEVDCIEGVKSADPIDQYIELKTSKIIKSGRDAFMFEKHKLIKYWAQSFLPGIPRVVVGFRRDDGTLASIREFRTLEIPRLVRGKSGMWDPTVCVNFADEMLNFLRRVIEEEPEDGQGNTGAGRQRGEGGNPRVTWTLRFRPPFREIELVREGEKNGFLTERYLRAVRGFDMRS